ncbi:MAG: hypothetical protein WC341_16855 [Bacteroidales bacterium]|jgi:hypothetical protein
MKARKEGDEVTIRSNEWYTKKKDKFGKVNVPFTFMQKMAQYCGKKAQIVAIKKDAKDELTGIVSDIYQLDIDNGFWTWSEKMFEPQTKTEKK